METVEPNKATARYLIRRFGLAYGDGVLTAGARGSMGQIWRLDLTDPEHGTRAAGDTVMVKQFFWGAGPDAEQNAQIEVAFCQAAAEAGVRVSKSLPTVDGTYVERLPEELGGATVRLNTWVAGRDLRLTDTDRAEYLGRTLGAMHALRFPATAEPDPYFTAPPSSADWDALAERVVSERERSPRIADDVLLRIQDLVDLGAYVDQSPQRDLICSHRDVKPGNVLVDGPSNEMTLIDWDEVGSVSPARELADQLFTWHVRSTRVYSEDIRRTVLAYRTAGGYGSVETPSSFSLWLAKNLNYIHGQVSAALEDDLAPDMRKYAEEEARRFVANLPTRAILESIIEAADV